ncbi:hypothetical protein [uncultured Cohaesibacter sp.]|uniref:hypothetical protein n=1 Tax=uncultured Cohaesibacter sp. TaxID=1002546 RepID=UPI00292DCCF5|nr:hypothetical protein [uncultured Cohaesibacter sp.]
MAYSLFLLLNNTTVSGRSQSTAGPSANFVLKIAARYSNGGNGEEDEKNMLADEWLVTGQHWSRKFG